MAKGCLATLLLASYLLELNRCTGKYHIVTKSTYLEKCRRKQILLVFKGSH